MGSCSPFGLKHKGGLNTNYNPIGNSTAQKFSYQGTELNESLGLNLHEMDFRQYDPAIARFTGVDPVVHWSNSPYNAFDNNPIYFADPSGADAVSSIQEAWDNTAPGTNSTWYNDGNGGLTDEKPEDPVEGQSKTVKKGVHGSIMGGTINETLYYHTGGIKGSKSGWYSLSNYLKKITPLAITLAGGFGSGSGGFGQIPSMSWVNDLEASPGFWTFLSSYSDAISGQVTRKMQYLKSGHAIPMGIDSPFFTLGLGFSSKFLGAAGSASEFTTVGRWMSKVEYEAMKSGTSVLEGSGGLTFVTVGGSKVFPSAAKGSVYAEFQVATNSLLQGGKEGWLKMIGPSASKSQKFLLQKQGGQLLPKYKNLSKILKVK